MSQPTPSVSLVDPIAHHGGRSGALTVAQGLLFASLVPFVAALAGHPLGSGWLGLGLAFGPFIAVSLVYLWLRYGGTAAGIKNDGIWTSAVTGRRWAGAILGVVLTGFYCVLYWWGGRLSGAAALLEPLSQLIRSRPADQWFLYGFLYTLAVLIMGARMFWRYRHNRYQLFRTASVMFFQLGFAFLLPAFLYLMNQPEFYFTYFWPLKPEYLFPGTISDLTSRAGGVGVFMVGWGIIASFVLTPLLTWWFGKRWYCSWVCGCGGLAETAGDPFRQLSDKSMGAWRFERWSIYTVLVLVVGVTAALWINSATNGAVLGEASQTASRWYGFVVGAVLSGVVGVGFYPLLGSRVWCRFFCPMAAILGIIQRFYSRFRITTNGGQCIACGNCSTYCEMGIDVRAYAMEGRNIVRASCVGCGICAAVCPRGVLKLEGGATHKDRFEGAEHPLKDLIGSLKRP